MMNDINIKRDENQHTGYGLYSDSIKNEDTSSISMSKQIEPGRESRSSKKVYHIYATNGRKKNKSRKRRKKCCSSADAIDGSYPTKLNTEELLEYYKRQTISEQELHLNPHYIHYVEMEEEKLKKLLASRSCHLPGNNWWQDWTQFITNNHPLFGIFMHHRLHPVTTESRLFILVASISFGLIATNLVYLYFMTSGEDFEKQIATINLELKDGLRLDAVLTSGLTMLLILNGVIHVIFDICMWHLTAATCCYHFKNHKLIKKYGTYSVLAISLMMVLLATYIIMVRVSYNINDGIANDWFDMIKIETVLAILGYIMQLSLVYFVMNPIIVTVLFSGALGCIPFCGGRPAAIELLLKEMYQERLQYFTQGDRQRFTERNDGYVDSHFILV